MRAVVVGGGLAGLSAALELVDRAYAVTLLEARPTLGGAVQTLPEREGDPEPPPDNGQHVALGCFEAYLAFLSRIGSSGSIRRTRLALPVIDLDGSVGTIATHPLALLRYRHLPFTERVRVALATRRLGRLDPVGHHDETLGDLLRGLGVSRAAIDRFWDVFVRPALNLRTDEVSAGLGIFTVQTAFLAGEAESDLLLPAAPLGAMHGEAAGRALADSGAEVRTNARVVELDRDAAVLADGERVGGDVFVVAVPPAESARLLGEPAPTLEDSPIVSVHLLLDRRVLEFPLAGLLASPAHWVFDRGRLTGREPARGQYLTVVSSAVPELGALRGRELVELVHRALSERLGQAELVWARVSREPAATIAVRPGVARPGARTARPNVARAGAWTDTGWPVTMESAVRSGTRAAHLLAELGARVAA